jgi:thymidylate synthase (FAD)
MSVKLTYSTPLYLISKGIRYSHNNHHLSDTEEAKKQYVYRNMVDGEDINQCLLERITGSKDYDLIKRVGFHMNHSYTLEHSLIVFDVKTTTKFLLEESRHRIGVSQTVTSSRYALDVIDIEYEPTRKQDVNEMIERHIEDIKNMLNKYRNEKGKIKKSDMDDIAMSLPQAFLYKLQLTFNLRSLVHFLELRLNSSAHYTIRNVAYGIINELPNDYRELIFENQKIKKDYELYKRSLNER